MKKALIVGLMALNLTLLGVLIFGTGVGEAQAQVYGTDYMLVTGRISDNYDAVFVIDLSTRRMIAFRMDRTTQKLKPYRGVELLPEFGRERQ
jgi:hypothetical protein